MPLRNWDRVLDDPEQERGWKWVGITSLVIYLFAFPLLYEVIGWEAAVFAWAPVLIVAAHWGQSEGLICTLGLAVYTALFILFLYPEDFDPYVLTRLAVWFAVMGSGGWTSGYIVTLRYLLLQEAGRRREIETRYENLFENTNDAVFIIGLDERHIAVNQRAAELLGYTREELLGMHITNTIAPDHYNNAQQRIGELQAHDRLPLYERHMRHRDGSTVPVEINASLIRDAKGEPLYIQSLLRDIRQRKERESDLIFRINHDDLTKLPNRTHYMESLQSLLANARQQSFNVAIFFLDLNGFKKVNDQYGHEIGDLLLSSLAQRMQDSLPPEVVFARMGGDEFALRLAPYNRVGEVEALAERIVTLIEEPFHIQGYVLRVSCSIGISLFPQDGVTLSRLLRNADEAMYRAKADDSVAYTLFGEAASDAADSPAR